MALALRLIIIGIKLSVSLKKAGEKHMMVYEKIEQIRKQKGVTKKHIAEKCNKSSAWYTDISRGRRGINVETLKLIANALEVDVRIF